MLKKLKIKIVVINMCLVGLVLLVVFAAVCSNTWRHGKDEVDRALEMALSVTSRELPEIKEIGAPPEEEGTPGPGMPWRNGEPAGFRESEGFNEKAMNYTAVVVSLDEVGSGYELLDPMQESMAMNRASMDRETLEKAVTAVRGMEEDEGRLEELGLFYRKQDTDEGIRAAFVDSAYFDATMRESLLNSLTMFLLGMAGLVLISILLSGMAVKPVKKAWEQQRRFVADASHELKTPLTVILANNEILLSSTADSPGEMRKWMESSQTEALHMKRLVDDLLFLARADEDAKGQSLVKSSIDLSELVTYETLQLEPVVFEVRLTMSTCIEENIVLECDAERMKKLIRILLDNAVKYAEDAGRIWLGLERTGGRIRMMTANTGAVIEEEALEHIFDRFYRSDQARTREGGYGLGLSIAKSIVEEHGGTLKARSGDLASLAIPAAWQVPQDARGTLMEVLL